MASVICKTDCDFATLDLMSFNEFFGNLLKKRLNNLVNFLKEVNYFNSWGKNWLTKITPSLTEVKITRGCKVV